MSDSNKKFFETAYRTGSDIWTHLPYQETALRMLPQLPNDSLVLDVGSGRGLWLHTLVKIGLRVIGIDYVQQIVDTTNKDIKLHKIEGKARFMLGDVRDIPLAEESFSLVTDIGLLQHLEEKDWPQYVNEIARVLQPNGYFLNVSLSRETTHFMGWSPKMAETGAFEKFGLLYYFFTKEELNDVLQQKFVVVEQQVRFFDTRSDPEDGIAMIFTLLQKK